MKQALEILSDIGYGAWIEECRSFESYDARLSLTCSQKKKKKKRGGEGKEKEKRERMASWGEEVRVAKSTDYRLPWW
jgi:hypothetical protein